MDAVITAVALVVVAIISWIGGRRRNTASAGESNAKAVESLTTAAAALVDPMRLEMAELRERIVRVEAERDLLVLRVDESEAQRTQLAARVEVLEDQIRGLGHTPVAHDNPINKGRNRL